MLVRVLQLLAIATALLHAVDASAAQPSVKLSTGATISGLEATNTQGKPYNKYLGIRYTDAPIGDKRWTQSSVKIPSEDVNATAYGDVCPGNAAVDAVSGQFPNNEDCLFLNVYTPAGVTSTSRLPVMVYIYGGGFVAGAGNIYDGGSLIGASNQKVIVVNFNYRLGALGFFQNEEILAEGYGANFGLRDQETAFLWVRKYISAFGGNPSDITAFGESAGTASIGYHLVARGGQQQMFDRAIMQSGGYVSVQSLVFKAKQAEQSATLAAAVGCNNVDGRVLACLREVPARAIFNASQFPGNRHKVDGVYVMEPVFASILKGKVSRVPTIIGANTNDGFSTATQFEFLNSLFSLWTDAERARLAELYSPTAFETSQFRVAEVAQDFGFLCAGEIYSDMISATVPDTYRYRFNFPNNTSYGIPLVLHALDVEYVFDHKYNLPNTTEAETVVGHFQKLWTNFAIYGSPNGKKPNDAAQQQQQQGPKQVWPRYNTQTKQQLILQPTLATEADVAYRPGHAERCAHFWQVETRLVTEYANQV